jgi:hypothetical protein
MRYAAISEDFVSVRYAIEAIFQHSEANFMLLAHRLVRAIQPLILCLAFVLFSGCALITPVKQSGCKGTTCNDADSFDPGAAGHATLGWWQIAIHYTWPENTEPAWHLDSFAADQIFYPIMQDSRTGIELWRFHRRAARDKAGHRFSWFFYSNSETARKIIVQVQADAGLQQLVNAGLVDSVTYSDIQLNSKPDIEDTSDNSWSLELQVAWPYYIQGASEMWMSLLRQLAQSTPPNAESVSLEGKLELYKRIQLQMDDIWQQQGSHAFLHHLNALFGYNMLYITERKLMRF